MAICGICDNMECKEIKVSTCAMDKIIAENARLKAIMKKVADASVIGSGGGVNEFIFALDELVAAVKKEAK